MKKLLIFALFLVATSTFVSCTREPIVEEVQTDIDSRGPMIDPMGYGPGIEPIG